MTMKTFTLTYGKAAIYSYFTHLHSLRTATFGWTALLEPGVLAKTFQTLLLTVTHTHIFTMGKISTTKPSKTILHFIYPPFTVKNSFDVSCLALNLKNVQVKLPNFNFTNK